MSDIDWARLAAYIDGEGCIIISMSDLKKMKKDGTPCRNEYLKVFIANTDPRLVLWCKDNFGGQIQTNRRQSRPEHKPLYYWVAVSTLAQDVLIGCLPFFVIKREQAEVGLAFQRTKKRGRRWVGISADVLSFRDNCFNELKRLKQERIPLDSALTH